MYWAYEKYTWTHTLGLSQGTQHVKPPKFESNVSKENEKAFGLGLHTLVWSHMQCSNVVLLGDAPTFKCLGEEKWKIRGIVEEKKKE